MIEINNYIGGSFHASSETMDVIDPSTGQAYGRLPVGGKEEVNMAVESAKYAAKKWAAMSVEDRSRILLDLADRIDTHREDLARCESLDTGKPLALSREVDIPRAAANFRFFAHAMVSFSSESHGQDGLAINYTQRAPLGIVGCISPWNLPLYLFSWKVAPALAAGNAVLGKPSEITPYTAFKLSELIDQTDMPKGVFNVLHGRGATVGQAIVEHPEVKAVSFTGGTATGRQIAHMAAEQLKKVSLELGGKNPTLVFEGADLERYMSDIVRSSFQNQGEICLCGSRLLVAKKIYESFKDKFLKELDAWTVGAPSESAKMGPLISQAHLEKVHGFVSRAIQDGGHLLAGGSPLEREGYFYPPTVLEGLSNACEINQQEVFGPVVTLQPFESEAEAVQLANDSSYGLAASIWTQDIHQGHRVANLIEAGIVWVNCWMVRDLRTPFGGVKHSGIGREGGQEALRFFTEPKNVCIQYQ